MKNISNTEIQLLINSLLKKRDPRFKRNILIPKKHHNLIMDKMTPVLQKMIAEHFQKDLKLKIPKRVFKDTEYARFYIYSLFKKIDLEAFQLNKKSSIDEILNVCEIYMKSCFHFSWQEFRAQHVVYSPNKKMAIPNKKLASQEVSYFKACELLNNSGTDLTKMFKPVRFCANSRLL